MRCRLAAFALIPIIALMGCQSAPQDGKIHLRYMAWGNPEQMEIEQQFCKRFGEENPDIEVEFLRVPGSAYQNKAILMMASRTAPDVLRIDHYTFPSLVRRNYFLDMDPLIAKDPSFHREDFFPQALAEGTYDGKLYGLNVLFGAQIIYYNKTMVKAAGLEDPYQLWKRGEWTYERYRRHAIAMTKFGSDGRPKQFGCIIPSFPLSAQVIWAFGGDMLNEDATKCRLGEPGAIAAYQFLNDLRWKDRCTPTPAQAANSQFTFESGKVGMITEWMGLTPRYRSVIKDFEWDVCPVPVGPAGPGKGMVLKGNQLVIYAGTKHPDAAWRFAKFITGEEVERALYVGLRRSSPTRVAIARSKEYLESKLPPFQMDTFLYTMENGRQLPITPRWSEWTTVASMEIDNLFSGREQDAAKVMKRAAARVDEVLADEEGF